MIIRSKGLSIVRKLGFTILCVALGACSSTATQTIQNITPSNPTATATYELYPAPQQTLNLGPYPAGQAEGPTSLFSPTPIVHWNADVIEVHWNGESRYPDPLWLSNTVAQLASYNDGYSDGYVTVDISAGKSAQPSAGTINSDWKIYSPYKTFVIECRGGMRMYRLSDHSIVSETPLLPPLSPGVVCSTFVRWAPDETMASFVDSARAVYVWRSDGTEPIKVLDQAASVNTAWSPNSQMLAIEKSEDNSHNGIANIIDSSGQILQEFQFQAGGDGAILRWLNDSILASYSRYTSWYYDLLTGQVLFSWTDMPTANGNFHQRPQVSPDNRWVFIDQGGDQKESASEPNHMIVRKQYSLYDIQLRRSILLLNDWGNFLRYVGWNADSSTLYVINRPQEPASTSGPNTPFGLLGYDVETGRYKMLFKDAVQVVWNADKSKAFVVFSVKDEAGQLGLDGGLWDFGSGTLVDRWHISNKMIYQDPAKDSFPSPYTKPVPVEWSHDSKYVAVSDEFGQVKLVRSDGNELILDNEVPGIPIALRWSPDDRHLLVSSDDRAWIVSISNP